jgi:cell division protein FtsQ
MRSGGAGSVRRWRLVRATSLAIPASVRRFNERRRARRIRTARPWLIAAAVLALAGIATFVVYGTSLFGVSHLRIVGSGFIGNAAVKAAAAVDSGTPLASIDLGDVAKRVEALPGVRRAHVHRDWPSTLIIDVTPRVAVAAVPAGKSYDLIDADGVVFQRVPAQPELPELDLATPGATDQSTIATLTILRSLPKGIRDQLIKMTAPTPANITLILRGGRQVIWGDASDNAAKGRVATSLLRLPGTVIDVSAPTVVTVK